MCHGDLTEGISVYCHKKLKLLLNKEKSVNIWACTVYKSYQTESSHRHGSHCTGSHGTGVRERSWQVNSPIYQCLPRFDSSNESAPFYGTSLKLLALTSTETSLNNERLNSRPLVVHTLWQERTHSARVSSLFDMKAWYKRVEKWKWNKMKIQIWECYNT